MNDDACITYQDVFELIEFDGETKEGGCADWYYDLRICPSGIYLPMPPDDVYLTPAERNKLPRHPTGDCSQPILAFPCTLGDLQNLLEDQGLADCIHPETLSEWLAERHAQDGPHDQQSSPIPPREYAIEPRIRAISEIAQEIAGRDGCETTSLPFGAKQEIRDRLGLTADKFKEAWTEAGARGLARLKDADKYKPRGGGKR